MAHGRRRRHCWPDMMTGSYSKPGTGDKQKKMDGESLDVEELGVRELIEVGCLGTGQHWLPVGRTSEVRASLNRLRHSLARQDRATSELRHDAAGHDDEALRPPSTTYYSTALRKRTGLSRHELSSTRFVRRFPVLPATCNN
jgi:hypothetical protein